MRSAVQSTLQYSLELCRVLVLVWLLLFMCGGSDEARANEAIHKAERPPDLFRMPEYALVQRNLVRPVQAMFRRRKFSEAEVALRQILTSYPNWPVHHYMLAAALALQGDAAGAVDSLETATKHGFTNYALLEHETSFRSLRNRPQFQKLLADIKGKRNNPPPAFNKKIDPKAISNGRALVDHSNTVWEHRSNLLLSAFSFPPLKNNTPVYFGPDPNLQLLNRWFNEGKSAGNYGDLYDNRDNDHSSISATRFQQLAHIEYSDRAKAAGRHYGVNSNQIFNAITIGNSSTALTGAQIWRSQARFMLSSSRLAARAHLQYSSNHLYIYPEHRDHDEEHGDVFPANTPYILISQGSSGSDKPFLQAVIAILAALPPDVKIWLRQRNLIAPTVQMIFRKGLKIVRSNADYLSAKAHPTVFDATNIDLRRMMDLAHDLRSDVVPPVIRLKVESEIGLRPGIDYFGPSSNDENLFTTPSAIARIHRSTAQERTMIVSAAQTKDPNGRPLNFTWRLLRGDPKKISITPISDNGAKAKIHVRWHGQRAVPFNGKLTTNRLDIGVFAHNGTGYSSPAFVSFYHPPNQVRHYRDDGKVLQVTYDANVLSSRYVDPTLFAARNWKDRYRYTEEGHLLGWVREFVGGGSQTFTRHGARAVAFDRIGRPIRAEFVAYRTDLKNGSDRSIRSIPLNRFVHYWYRDSRDAIGRASLCNQHICHHR